MDVAVPEQGTGWAGEAVVGDRENHASAEKASLTNCRRREQRKEVVEVDDVRAVASHDLPQDPRPYGPVGKGETDSDSLEKTGVTRTGDFEPRNAETSAQQ